MTGPRVFRFPFLAQPPHRFAQPDCQRGNSFKPHLTALRQLTVILAAHFRKQQLCIS